MVDHLSVVAEEVSFHYGTALALDSVSFALSSGEMLGIVGPNGSGKSTLIKVLCAVLRPSSGRVSIDDQPVHDVPRKRLARMLAVVPQSPVLPPTFTSLEVVLMGRTPHLGLLQAEGHRDWAAVHRAMTETDTLQLAERRIGDLSGGERQRVVIARALAQEPSLMLLDEPTTHLDLAHQLAILDLVKKLNQESGMAVAAVFHDLSLAAQYCHRLLMLCSGRLYAQGTPREVITSGNIAGVYGPRLSIMPHPGNGLPMVVAAPREASQHDIRMSF